MKTKTHKWLHGLGSAAVTGIATSFLSALGITGVDALGLKVAQLDFTQLAVITAMGGFVGAAAYLKQSPLPPETDNENTTNNPT